MLCNSVLTPSQIVGINPETVTNTASTDFPGHWPGEDHAWNTDKFREVQPVQAQLYSLLTSC